MFTNQELYLLYYLSISKMIDIFSPLMSLSILFLFQTHQETTKYLVSLGFYTQSVLCSLYFIEILILIFTFTYKENSVGNFLKLNSQESPLELEFNSTTLYMPWMEFAYGTNFEALIPHIDGRNILVVSTEKKKCLHALFTINDNLMAFLQIIAPLAQETVLIK